MDQLRIRELVKKYRYVLLVLLAGVILMCLPDEAEKEEVPVVTEAANEDLESRLERILSRIAGAGEVVVVLTESQGEEFVYQTDSDGADTVLITDENRNEQGLVRTRKPPSYRGAVIVCSGADSAVVRLAVVEAVANATGLGTDKITVLKMG